MLIVQNLKCSYGHIQALSGIGFKVNQGDIVTLIGNNGAGKSTTLNAICGIAPKVSGEVVFRGRRIEKLSSDRIISLGICQVPEGKPAEKGIHTAQVTNGSILRALIHHIYPRVLSLPD